MNKIETIQIADLMYNRHKEKYNSPGWTEWAIIGAFASIIWLTLDLLENGNFNIVTTAQTFITISLVYLAVSPVYLHIHTVNDKQNNKYFLKPVVANKYVQFILLARVVLMGLIIGTMYRITIYENLSHKIICNLLIIIELIFIIFQIRRNKKGLDISVQGKSMIRLLSILKYGNVYFTALFLFLFLQTNIELKSYSSIKLGLVLFAFSYLTEKLIFTKSDNTVFNQIDQIRGQLIFDTISPKEAVNKLKIIEYGLTYEDYISIDIEAYYMKLIGMEKKLLESASLIESIGHLKDEKAPAILDVVAKHIDNLLKEFGEIESIVEKIINTTKSLKMYNNALIDYQSTSTLLKEPLVTIKFNIKNLSQKLVQLRQTEVV